MLATKSKPARASEPRWTNQVVRTADGRLVVRGVDVPSSGTAWERVSSGKDLPAPSLAASAPGGKVLTAVTSRTQALATARRAGLVHASKTAASPSNHKK